MIALPFMVAAIAITAMYFYYQSEDTKLSSSVMSITKGLEEKPMSFGFEGNYLCLDFCRSYNEEYLLYEYKLNNFTNELKARLVAEGYDIVLECPNRFDYGDNYNSTDVTRGPECSGYTIIKAEKNNTEISISSRIPNEDTEIGKQLIVIRSER